MTTTNTSPTAKMTAKINQWLSRERIGATEIEVSVSCQGVHVMVCTANERDARKVADLFAVAKMQRAEVCAPDFDGASWEVFGLVAC